MVVLNTSETISDLLDQRSAIYSDKVGVFSVPRALDFSQALIVSSPATSSDARAVSLPDRWCLNGISLTCSRRNFSGQGFLTTSCLSCLTGRAGVHTESCSATSSVLQRRRTMTQTSAKRYRNSLSTFTEDQRVSRKISICASPIPCDPARSVRFTTLPPGLLARWPSPLRMEFRRRPRTTSTSVCIGR